MAFLKTKTAYLVAGLAYGDEGKGATVDFLANKHDAGLVIRYNGGMQAAHNVVTEEGTHHTFSQFGSGTFAGVSTFLSKHVIVEPISMMSEANALLDYFPDIWDRIYVDCNALVATPFQKTVNRIIEQMRGKGAHGTCGLGIGQTRSDHLKYGNQMLLVKDLENPNIIKEKMRFIRQISRETVYAFAKTHNLKPNATIELEYLEKENNVLIDWCIEAYARWPKVIASSRVLSELLDSDKNVIFEGAQGLLLDEKYGLAPHNTWTDITFGNANQILAESLWTGQTCKVGVVRSYYTRHGAGPFPTEDASLAYEELHNNDSGFQGKFRKGTFDWKQFRYALLALGGIDTLALNHLDVIADSVRESLMHELRSEYDFKSTIHSYGQTRMGRTEIILQKRGSSKVYA